jgi:hypothetical protein
MANTSSVKGLMTLLGRDEWREAFAEIQRAHVFVACHNASVGTGDMTRKENLRSQGCLLQRGQPVDRRRLAVASRPNVTLHAAQPPPVKASTFPKGAHHGLCHR